MNRILLLVTLCTLLVGCGCLEVYPKYEVGQLELYPKIADYSGMGIYPKLCDYSGLSLFPTYTWLDSSSKFEIFPKIIQCPAK